MGARRAGPDAPARQERRGSSSTPATSRIPPPGWRKCRSCSRPKKAASLPEPYSALSEVAVTRRAYRSGESEYLLNKIPCRLKDITEFFMAAQIHSRGYSLVEQGRIEEIIQAKPHELRTLVEEAAGLSLFKGRREMSERKLERVKENLARVDDVLSEIERQLSFARRQAKKAETYKVVKAELGELERYSAARRLIDQREELADSDHASHGAEELAGKRARRRRGDSRAGRGRGLGRAVGARRSSAALSASSRIFTPARSERARTRGFLQRRLDATAQLEIELGARLVELESNATARARQSRRSGRDPRARNRSRRRRRRRCAQGNLAQARSGDSRTQAKRTGAAKNARTTCRTSCARPPSFAAASAISPASAPISKSVSKRPRSRRPRSPPRSKRRARRCARPKPTSKLRARSPPSSTARGAQAAEREIRSAHRARPSDRCASIRCAACWSRAASCNPITLRTASTSGFARSSNRSTAIALPSIPSILKHVMRAPLALEPALKAVLGPQTGRRHCRVAAICAPRNRNPQRESRRPDGLCAGARRRRHAASVDRRARHRGPPGRDARSRIALLAGRRSDAWSRDARRRPAFRARRVEPATVTARFSSPATATS